MTQKIENILHESRAFPPSSGFKATAHVASIEQYQRLHKQSLEQPEVFWDGVAKELPWMKPYGQVLDWSEAPNARWFVDGKLNASAVCLDQHIEAGHGDKVAILWEGEPGDRKTFTYSEMHAAVCRFANALKARGIKKGDRIAIYMPMIPELAMAVLACARIGAIHSVVFGGFSAQALADRITDGGCVGVITSDGGWRRGKVLPLKDVVDAAVELCGAHCPVHTVLTVKRTENEIKWNAERDVWYHELLEQVDDVCEPEPMDSEDVLFLLYTSGSTGKPKGIMHTTGGYMVGAYLSARHVFDLKDDDVFWCTADVGWITGHSYVVYGPMANGATQVMYEGAPNAPTEGRFWELIERYKVSVFYTAPTAIRAFMKWGDQHVDGKELSSLRLLGTVGEPINPEAWMWYRKKIGGERCPIVDTWWQTETGGIMISPLPGITETTPGCASLPFFGVDAVILDGDGNELGENEGGFLAIRKPWPSMLRGLWGDEERYRETYWSKWPGNIYFPGDGARRDEKGHFWILGRVDDVINVSGHRLSTMEVESALVSHDLVVEAAVVGRPDDLTGEAIVAFVIPAGSATQDASVVKTLKEHVAIEIGKLARPAEVRLTDALPKTRSGKIMRRRLRDIADGREQKGDMSTIENPAILEQLRAADV